MRHLTKESTSSGFFSEVMKRSGSASSKVRMRMSKWRTFWISGHLKCRPALVTTSLTSPSWNTIAFWRWSTVNSALEAMSAISATTASTGPNALMSVPFGLSSLAPLAVAQRLARARRGLGRRGLRRRRPLRGLRLGGQRGAALLHQLVERQVEDVAGAAVVHHDLVGRGQHLLDRLEVDALAGHGRRLRVLGEHLLEARGVALGAGDDALLVALGLLLQARSVAAGARDHVVGVGLALVLLLLAVLAGLHRVVERGLHLLGRLRRLDRHRLHRDAGAVAVVDRLHQLARADRDRLARLVQDAVHLALADHLAHRGLGDLHRRLVGAAHVEDEVARVLYRVLHRELQVDDVLVARQHQRFLGHLV